MGACRALCEKNPGLPHVAHSHFKTAPTDPPQGTAEPSSQAGGPSGKTYFKRAKSCPAVRTEEETASEHQGQRRRRGRKSCSGCWRRDHPASHGENHGGADGHFLTGNAAGGEPILDQIFP